MQTIQGNPTTSHHTLPPQDFLKNRTNATRTGPMNSQNDKRRKPASSVPVMMRWDVSGPSS